MDFPLGLGILCAAGILLGLLLLSIAPEIGAGMIFVVCSLVLLAWACRS